MAPEPDPFLQRIAAALALGPSPEARSALDRLWAEVGPGGDALHRCALAHHMADLQPSAEDELMWDERALSAVEELTEDRVRAVDGSLQVRALLPSLHLNLADDHRRLGSVEASREHLARAVEAVEVLADDDYGRLVRRGLADLAAALDAGSVARLPSDPRSG